MIGWVCGPIGSSMPSLIAGLPARPTPTMRPSLMPMSALTTPMSGIDDERAGDDDVELRRAGPALGRARPDGLGVAPDRLVAGRLPVLLDADPQVGVAEADAVAGRRPVAGEAFLRGEAGSPCPPRRRRSRTRRTVRVSPGAQRSVEPAGRSRRKPGRGRAVEDEARVDALERVVRRDPDDPRRVVADRRAVAAVARVVRRGARASTPCRIGAGSVVRGRAERIEQHDEPRPVVHQDLERDLVDERPHARHDLGRIDRRTARPPRPRRTSAPARAASSIASQMSAIASGALSASPAARCRRASSAAVKMRSRSSSQGVSRIAHRSGAAVAEGSALRSVDRPPGSRPGQTARARSTAPRIDDAGVVAPARSAMNRTFDWAALPARAARPQARADEWSRAGRAGADTSISG